jgi:SDR family mycofactocin-dependent oxidoreductase
MAGRVAGKVALITGAARGQGRAHAVRLAQEGADVIAVDIAGPLPEVAYDSPTPADLAETARLVEKEDRRIVTAQVDVRDLAALRAAVERGVAELGRLDIVVANAGICVPRAWDQVTPEIFAATIDTNLTGVWNTVQVSAQHVIAAGGGSIILVSSAAGLKVQPFMVPYTASKWAVRGMAKAFAVELSRHYVRVNSLHPGGVDTPMGSGRMQEVLGEAMASDQRLGAMFMPLLPYRTAEPEDISNAVVFLASDDSKFVTGHEIAPDGGVTEF